MCCSSQTKNVYDTTCFAGFRCVEPKGKDIAGYCNIKQYIPLFRLHPVMARDWEEQ